MKNVPRTRVPGPLAPFADGFRTELDKRGYTAGSREFKISEMSVLSRWLEREGHGAGDLSSARVGEWLADFDSGRSRVPTLKAMQPLVDWLRNEGVIAADPATPGLPLDDLMDRYRHWMIAERDLAARTVGRYEHTARVFLGGRVTAGAGNGIEGIKFEAVTNFLLAEVSRGLSRGVLQGRVAELRSLLRFLFLKGLIDSPLADAVPPVPGWKDTAVPRRLSTGQVRAVVESCDRTTTTGVRDFAMLVLLARLGLRAAEVADLSLDDVQWRAGELIVRGKARREDRMPLPTDVGEALAAYVVDVRPHVECRTFFRRFRVLSG